MSNKTWRDEKDKLILLSRYFENGDVSLSDFVCEGYHLLKETGHTWIDKRLDFNELRKKSIYYEEKLKKEL